MGMFTTIYHPVDGRELQIKSGDDDCEFYRVGEEVDFRINPNWPGCGKLFDGVYGSASDAAMDDDWVVIKDHRIAAVEPRDIEYEVLQAKYDIQRYDKSWWTQEAWDKYEEIQKEAKARADEFKRQVDSIEDPAEKHAFIMSQFMLWSLNRVSIARKMFLVDDLPTGALAKYDPDDENNS